MNTRSRAAEFRSAGILRLEQVIDLQAMERLRQDLDGVTVSAGSRRETWGLPIVMDLAQRLAAHVGDHLALTLAPAWITFFDKRPERNWLVPRHRDDFLPIQDRAWAEGIGCQDFQIKEGLLYAIAPSWVYDQIVAARLAVDHNHAGNGPLEALIGSHRTESSEGDLVPWEANIGDVVVMHPRCVHASRKIQVPDRRRVLHVNLVHPDLVGRVGTGSIG
jgi:hypothetical protein